MPAAQPAAKLDRISAPQLRPLPQPPYPMIKLLVDTQYASPYALSAYVALREKQVDFRL